MLRRESQDREILRLALPALGALVAEPLFLLADSAVVGHLGTRQLAALGVAGSVMGAVVYLFVFLAFGTTAAVARQVGAGDLGTAVRTGVDGVWLATGLGAAIVLLGQVLAPAVVDAFDATPAVAADAVMYLRIGLVGVPAMLVVLAATGVLRGLQDTRTPLVVAAAGAAGNIVLNIVLVYPAGLGLAGSALGTVLAQTGMAAAYVQVVLRAARRYGASTRPHGPGIRAAVTGGVPLFLRTAALQAVLVAATATASRLGDVPLAAHQVAFNIWSFLALILDAIAIAAQAIVGRCLGAGDVTAARAATRRMMQWGAGAGVLLGLVFALGRPLYVPLFTDDVAVRSLLASVLLVVAVMQPAAGVVFVLDGVLIGAGDGRYLAAAGVVAMVVFLAAAWLVLALGGGLVALWCALTAFILARLVLLTARSRGTAWAVPGAVR